MKAPLVSVVIPAFNAGQFLAEALASIRRQHFSRLEILVVDDGSKDNTSEIASKSDSELRYFFQKNAGPAAARNRGIREARGEMLAFLDADDLWPESSLELRLRSLASDPGLSGVIGKVQGFCCNPQDGKTDQPWFSEPWSLPMLVGGTLYHRRVFELIGFFNESLPQGEDLDWYLRLRESGLAVRYLEEVTLYYRLHQAGLTRDKAAVQQGLARALKLSLERRRDLKKGGNSG